MTDTREEGPRAESARALELLGESRTVLLTGHQRPDGDCIGAQAAFTRLLGALGKRALILNPDPPEARYEYLSGPIEYGAWRPGDAIPEHDLCVLLDCSELSRCGQLGEALRAAPSRKLVIDHHPHGGDDWWDAAYRDPRASATGLLVHRLATELGVELDEVGKQGVFTSIVTDTGWFRYSNTDSETMRLASELIAGGIEPSRMYRSIYQTKRPSALEDLRLALSRLRYLADHRLGVIALPLDLDLDPERFDSDDALDLVRSVREIEVVLLAREVEAGLWKLSARSKTNYDVNQLARRYGGGGHSKAAGATLRCSLAELDGGIFADAARELAHAAGTEEAAREGDAR